MEYIIQHRWHDDPLPASRTVLKDFTNSQHRPIIIDVGLKDQNCNCKFHS